MSNRADRGGSLTFADIPVYHLTAQQILSSLNVDPKQGLTDSQIPANREEWGSNSIIPPAAVPWYKLLLHQVLNAITVILLICAVVTAVNHEWIDMTVILAIIVLNTIIGFVSEMKSASSLAALKNMTKGVVTVLRNGSTTTLSIDDVVVGDIMILRAGDSIGADARIIASNLLEVDEMTLTGESIPIFKGSEAIPLPTTTPGLDVRVAIGDRTNMVFRNTTVVGGTGAAVVCATGDNTKIGQISKRLKTTSSKTQFQKNLDIFMYILFGIAIFLAFIIFCIVKFKINTEIIVYAASTAIALLPEALIMVVSIALSLGMSRLASKKAIVSKMNVLTEIGSLTHAISDKTGTLTLGQMCAKRVWPYGSNIIYHITGGPMDRSGAFGVEFDVTDPNSAIAESAKNTRAARAETRAMSRSMSLHGNIQPIDTSSRYIQPSHQHNVMKIITGTPECELTAVQEKCEELALVAGLCNNTILQIDEENDMLVGSGFNPTEASLTVFTHKLGLPPAYFEDNYGWTKRGTHAFDSTVKRMSVGVIRDLTDEQGNILPGKRESLVLTKGAPEAILPICSNVNMEEVLPKVEHLASSGFRVLALAIGNHLDLSEKELHEFDRTLVEQNLRFVGLVVVFDPPREESFVAVKKCKEASIEFIMATGDHHSTATNIARRLGILTENDGPDRVTTGPIIDSMSDEQLDQLEHLPLVVGRCSPNSKVKLVEAIQRRGGRVSVSGDGVNDVPAINQSDCGFAMGIAGTELTKQAAHVVLTDDNISTMINVIEEGRHIQASIRRFIVHLLSSNIAEVIILLLGLIWRDAAGQPVFPLSPLQILTINLITSSPPAVAITLDDLSPDLMHHPPQKSSFFTPEVVVDQLVTGAAMGLLSLVSYLLVIFTFGNGVFGLHCNTSDGANTCNLVWEARTTAYATLYMLLLVQGYVCRNLRKSVFSTSLVNNPVMVASFIGGALFIMLTIYIPPIAKNLFKHAPIDWHWAIVVINMIIYLAFTELYKVVKCAFINRGKPTEFKKRRKGEYVTSDGGVIEIR